MSIDIRDNVSFIAGVDYAPAWAYEICIDNRAFSDPNNPGKSHRPTKGDVWKGYPEKEGSVQLTGPEVKKNLRLALLEYANTVFLEVNNALSLLPFEDPQDASQQEETRSAEDSTESATEVESNIGTRGEKVEQDQGERIHPEDSRFGDRFSSASSC
jgi:hypothetical protein